MGPDSERGARRVELRLYDTDKTMHQAEGRSTMNRLIPEAMVRARAAEVFGTHMSENSHPTDKPATKGAEVAPMHTDGLALSSEAAVTAASTNRPPTVSVEEVTSDG